MTPRAWKKLFEATQTRNLEPSMLSLEAQKVLGQMLVHLSRGGVTRTLAEIAVSVGFSERQLRRALDELKEFALVRFISDPADARFRLPIVCEDRVQGYADGTDVTFEPEEGEIGTKSVGTFGPYSKADGDQNGPYPRVRGGLSSSSSSTSSSQLTSVEVFSQHQAMVVAVRSAIGYLPPASVKHIWTWVGRYPVELVQYLAPIASVKGGRSVAYLESMLSNHMATELYPEPAAGIPEGVLSFEQHRGLRPWHHNDPERRGGA